MRQTSKAFFSEEKKQKTFVPSLLQRFGAFGKRLDGGALALALVLLSPVPAWGHRFEATVPGGSVRLTQRGAHSVISGTVAGRRFTSTLPAEDGIYAGSLQDVQFVGGLPGRVLILSVDYMSRPNGPEYECGAGIETVLRVVALGPRPHETFHLLVGSCWSDIDPAEIAWDNAASS